MKSPEYLVIINDWFLFQGESSSHQTIIAAIERYNKWSLDMRNEYYKASDEEKKLYDLSALHREVESIKVYDFNRIYKKI